VAVKLNNYIFVVLLALIVNFSITAVGVLLINALLIVPAATAANLAPNMRKMFLYTLGLSVVTGVAGLGISQSVALPIGPGDPKQFGVSGTIIVLGVILFALSLLVLVVRQKLGHIRPRPAV
jgi:zinc transport system permease protein